jgi:hypothetical protein
MRSSAGVIAMRRGADVGVGHKGVRKRAVGTREHVIAYLTEVSELYDANGMASTHLAAAVGYPGSSVAFAQLLSGMERSGLIEREVRGKRTYRISLGVAHALGAGEAFRTSGATVPSGVIGTAGVASVPGILGATGGVGAAGVAGIPGAAGVAGIPGAAGVAGIPGAGSGIGATGFDYDELARRLLVQVVRRLAATEPESESSSERLDRAALQETVSGLEYELATAWTKHGKLAEENVRLREQLRAAQRSLALAAERVRKLSARSDLDSSEVTLLQRLLGTGGADTADDSDSRQEGLDEARSVVS